MAKFQFFPPLGDGVAIADALAEGTASVGSGGLSGASVAVILPLTRPGSGADLHNPILSLAGRPLGR